MAFPGTGNIWMNGKFVDWNDAQIHIASHVIHYGSGVFEGARCYDTRNGPACFRLDAHMRRLLDSATIYRMESPYDQRSCPHAVVELIKRNGFKACYIRPLVYRGYDSLGVNPFPCPVDVAIMLWEWGAYFTKDAIEEGLDVKISTWARNAPEHHAVDGQERGQLRQLAADQDGSDPRGLRRGHRARHRRQPQRRQRPEHLHRPRRRHPHAAGRARRSCRASPAIRW